MGLKCIIYFTGDKRCEEILPLPPSLPYTPPLSKKTKRTSLSTFILGAGQDRPSNFDTMHTLLSTKHGTGTVREEIPRAILLLWSKLYYTSLSTFLFANNVASAPMGKYQAIPPIVNKP